MQGAGLGGLGSPVHQPSAAALAAAAAAAAASHPHLSAAVHGSPISVAATHSAAGMNNILALQQLMAAAQQQQQQGTACMNQVNGNQGKKSMHSSSKWQKL
jgi:beta-lactamase class A